MTSYRDRIFDKITQDTTMKNLIHRLDIKPPSLHPINSPKIKFPDKLANDEVYSLRRIPPHVNTPTPKDSFLSRCNSYSDMQAKRSPDKSMINRDKARGIRDIIRTVSIEKLNRRINEDRSRNALNTISTLVSNKEVSKGDFMDTRQISEFQRYVDGLDISSEMGSKFNWPQKIDDVGLNMEKRFGQVPPLVNPDRSDLISVEHGRELNIRTSINSCFVDRISNLVQTLNSLNRNKEALNISIKALKNKNIWINNEILEIKTKRNLLKNLKSHYSSLSPSTQDLKRQIILLDEKSRNLSLSQIKDIEAQLRSKAEANFIAFLIRTIKQKNINAKHLIKELERLK